MLTTEYAQTMAGLDRLAEEVKENAAKRSRRRVSAVALLRTHSAFRALASALFSRPEPVTRNMEAGTAPTSLT